MSVIPRPATPNDLLSLPDGQGFELVNGELVEKNVSVLSARVEMIVLRRLDDFCTAHKAGPVFPGTLGIRCFPDDPTRVRKPDAFFVKLERFKESYWQDGFLTIHPDLAAELVSPNDLASDVAEKIEEYLAAGVSLVWVIDPEVKNVVIHRADGSVAKLHIGDELTGENVLPGFRCKVSELFPQAGQ